MGVMNPTAVMKNIIPVIMAGVLGIYGLIVSVILIQKIHLPQSIGDGKYVNKYAPKNGFAHLAAGLCCGLSCLGAGYAIGLVGDVGARAAGYNQNQVYVGLILILIFAEALGLYGLIVALILSQTPD